MSTLNTNNIIKDVNGQLNIIDNICNKINKIYVSTITPNDIINKICTHIDVLEPDMVNYNNTIIMPNQPVEREDDNREYKLYLEFNNCPIKFESRSTQLLYRLTNGEGKALYLLGIYDDGRAEGIELNILIKSISNVCKMAENIGGSVKRVNIYNAKRMGYYVGSVRLEIPDDKIVNDIFVMV